MATINDTDVIVIVSNATGTDYQDGCVLLFDANCPAWMKTSQTGLWIYNKLKDQPNSVEGMTREAVAHYGIPAELMQISISAFMQGLVRTGLAVVENGCTNEREALMERFGNDHLRAYGLSYVFFNILSDCNLNCPYCFVRRNGAPISLENSKVVIDQAAELQPKVLTISGGEPFMHPHLLEILRHARDRADWYLTIATNGTVGDHDTLAKAASLVDNIQFSFDGVKPEVHDATRGAGSYAKTMAAMLRLRELKCSAERTLAFTPTPNNVDEIQQLYGFATLMGANTLRMNAPQRPAHVERMEHCGEFDYLSSEFYKQCFDKWDRMVGDLLKDTLPFVSEMDMVRMPQLSQSGDPLSDLMVLCRRTSCGAGGTTLFINESGDVYPCSSLSGPENRLGNMFAIPLAAIHSGPAAAFRRSISVERIEDCAGCDYRFLCAGGCRAHAHSPAMHTHNCNFTKKRFEIFFRAISRPQIRPNPQDSKMNAKRLEEGLPCEI